MPLEGNALSLDGPELTLMLLNMGTATLPLNFCSWITIKAIVGKYKSIIGIYSIRKRYKILQISPGMGSAPFYYIILHPQPLVKPPALLQAREMVFSGRINEGC